MNITEGFNYTGLWDGYLPERERLVYQLVTNSTFAKIPLLFDFGNDVMALMREIAAKMYWVMIGIIVTQFFLLMWRGVGLLPVWTLIEYMQLVAFMPIYNFRLIPYLYDAFKPSLVSHMIIFDESFWLADMDDDYFNENYENYWLSIGRMGQSLMFISMFSVIIVVANFVIFFMSKCFRGEGGCARCVRGRLA